VYCKRGRWDLDEGGDGGDRDDGGRWNISRIFEYFKAGDRKKIREESPLYHIKNPARAEGSSQRGYIQRMFLVSINGQDSGNICGRRWKRLKIEWSKMATPLRYLNSKPSVFLPNSLSGTFAKRQIFCVIDCPNLFDTFSCPLRCSWWMSQFWANTNKMGAVPCRGAYAFLFERKPKAVIWRPPVIYRFKWNQHTAQWWGAWSLKVD